MSEITCEFIIGSRAKDGRPTLCGTRAGAYQMAGGLGFVPTALCDKHVKVVRKLGYQLAPLDASLTLSTQGHSPASDEEYERAFAPLFAHEVAGVSE